MEIDDLRVCFIGDSFVAQDPVWMAEVSAGDGAHPGAAGYAKLAALVDGWECWWFGE